MELVKKIAAFFFDIIEVVVVALAIFVVVYLFFFQPHQVKGASMDPNFHDNEYILTDKISYRFHTPQRGDVVIFRAPQNRELDYIKRVIGLPGEKVKVQGGEVFVNGQRLKESYLPANLTTNAGDFLRAGQDYQIPADNYIVFGDNRPHSSDSRAWGPVVKEDIIGKAWLRYWPPQDFGLLPQVSY